MSPNQHFELALKVFVRDATQSLRIENSLLQRNQPLFNGYYLWISEAYHLELILYDKWRIYFFKNGQMQAKVLLLVNAGLTPLYDDMKLYNRKYDY
jgi:hypothetical protein